MNWDCKRWHVFCFSLYSVQCRVEMEPRNAQLTALEEEANATLEPNHSPRPDVTLAPALSAKLENGARYTSSLAILFFY